jgi:2-(1,2-epoxy-1,2-dihydrophenyl)acetyl-CoA isomerase
MKYIILEKSEGIATVTFNRPDKLNAFNWEMEGELHNALEQVGEDKDVRVLVITGAGSAFCTGADVEEMFQEIADRGGLTGREQYDMPFRNMVPVIASINGLAIGAGLTITLQCDIRIAAEEARFSLPFVPFGLAPEAGSTYFLSRLIGIAKACELVFTGKTITAKEAKEIGLVNEVVPAAELKETTYKLAKRMAQGAPLAMQMSKKGLYQGLEASIKDQIEYEKATLMTLTRTEDFQEAIKAFQEKRRPIFKGK